MSKSIENAAIGGIIAGVIIGSFWAFPAHAVVQPDPYVFVWPSQGNDATCNIQRVAPGVNPNLIYAGTTPCKTNQRACQLGEGVSRIHVAPVADNYAENFICNISGASPATPAFWHIAEQVKNPAIVGGAVRVRGVLSNKFVGEFTGDNINVGCAFCHFEGYDPTLYDPTNTTNLPPPRKPKPPFFIPANSGGIWMHGTATRHAQNQKFYYGTDVSRNTGVNIKIEYSDGAVLTSDTIANSAGSSNVIIKDSIGAYVYANAIYRCGAIIGVPAMAARTPGIVFINSPHSELEDGKAWYGCNPSAQFFNSPYSTIEGNHVVAAGYPPFSWTISPASDIPTFTISEEP